MSRCKGCNSIFTPPEIYETDEKGNRIKFLRFEELCTTCSQFCWTEMPYHELFEDRWVKPVDNS
jgi:uncharacterized protein with PIN domain